MFLLFFKSVSNPFSKTCGGFWKSEECISHDFDSKKLMTCKSVEANSSIIQKVELSSFWEFIAGFMAMEAHSYWSYWFFPKDGGAWLMIGEFVRAKEFIF
jgi:hypothetical protein